MSRFSFTSLLITIVALELVLTWTNPSADPPIGYSTDNSLSMDGHWYAAQAREWSTGHANDARADYQQVLHSIPTYGFFQIFGVSFASSRALSSLASVLTILLLAYVVKKRFGSHYALLACGLLALHPAWHAFVRSPVIYPWVSFWFLLCIAVAARPGRHSVWLAAGLMLLVAAGLKTIVAVLVPGLIFELACRLRSRYGSRVAWQAAALATCGAAVGTGLVFWMWPEFQARIAWYASGMGESDASWWTRIAFLENRSHLLSAAPILVPLAAVSALLFATRVSPTAGGTRRFERIFHTCFWPVVAVFSVCGYSPLRYLLMFFPAMCYVAVSAIHALVHSERARALPLKESRGVLVGGTAVVTLTYIAGLTVSAAIQSELPGALVGAVASFGLLLFLVWNPQTTHRRVLYPAGLLAVSLLVATPRWHAVFAESEWTLEQSSYEIAAILPKDARLVGPYAHAVTVENALYAQQLNSLRFGKGKLKQQFAKGGWSHMVNYSPKHPSWYQRFAADGLDVEVLATVRIRDRHVDVVRVHGSDIAPSDFELGRRALAAKNPKRAFELFRACIESSPRSGLCWTGLGESMLLTGDIPRAHEALSQALVFDPDNLRANELLRQISIVKPPAVR